MAVLAMVFSLGAVSSAQAAVAKSKLSLSPSTAIGGEMVKASGRVPGAVSRPVWVQRKIGTRWVAMVRAKTTRTGTYATSFKAPAIGSYSIRTLAPRVTIARRVRAESITSVRTLTVVAQAAALSMPATLAPAQTAIAKLTFRPIRAGRAVALQVWRPAGWIAVATGRQSAAGTASLPMTAGAPASYAYRAWTAAAAGAPAFANLYCILKVTAAPDITAPAPITALNSTVVSATSIKLDWVNPAAADFTGVTIRRMVGNTAPSFTTGILVTGGVATATSYIDTGLTAGTKYSYAVFAHDGAGNHAAAAATFGETPAAADVKAPGLVTALAVTVTGATSIKLDWVNPTDADFTGVTIRRALGDVAPTFTTGTEVTDTAILANGAGKFTTSFTDNNGLTLGGQYSYAVFAHDGAGNYATAVRGTATTKTIQPTAVLSINGSTGTTAKTSVGAYSPHFDMTGSLAGSGGALLWASLDYGDGTLKTFNGVPATWSSDHDYATVGDKKATLTVVNTVGDTATSVVTVSVHPMPAATITQVTPNPIAPGQLVTFALTSSTAPGTVFTDYDFCFELKTDPTNPIWNRQSGLPPTTITHTFAADGVYDVEFYVYNDADGWVLASVVGGVKVDGTAPASVTDLTAKAGAGSIALAWTNSTDADFAGVTIRRLLGDVAPTFTTGTEVTDTGTLANGAGKTTTSFTDTGLALGAQYSYAVFAHDGSGNHAAATKITPPTAALSINGSTGATAKTSVGGWTPVFDVTGSLAGPGRTLVSAQLVYGDGTKTDFTGLPGTWSSDHAYTTAGDQVATVLVTDSAGDTATAAVTVSVYAKPTATINLVGTATAGSVATFDVTSLMPAGTAFTYYTVSYGDGAVEGTEDTLRPTTLKHKFSKAGIYTVLFSVYNDADGWADASTTVTVLAP